MLPKRLLIYGRSVIVSNLKSLKLWQQKANEASQRCLLKRDAQLHAKEVKHRMVEVERPHTQAELVEGQVAHLEKALEADQRADNYKLSSLHNSTIWIHKKQILLKKPVAEGSHQ